LVERVSYHNAENALLCHLGQGAWPPHLCAATLGTTVFGNEAESTHGEDRYLGMGRSFGTSERTLSACTGHGRAMGRRSKLSFQQSGSDLLPIRLESKQRLIKYDAVSEKEEIP
jgi:hypothetical protein